MKRTIAVPFLIFIVITLLLTFLITQQVNGLFELSKAEPEGQSLVNINDISNNVKAYLADNNADKLNKALKLTGYDLLLYGLDGNIIFKSKENDGKKDINKALSETGPGEKILYMNYPGEAKAIAIIYTNQVTMGTNELKRKSEMLVWTLCLLFILLIASIFIFIYLYLLRPFKKLEHFAAEVARGNLDIPLLIKRRNIFGAFSWAFDMLRNELKTSKEQQAEAERTKKELVAALSHDIRTPIASIRAYAECLKSLPVKDSERGERYIDVIMKKTDEIAKLSQDMFMHALSDLEKLELEPGEYHSRELLNSILEPLILAFHNRMVIVSAIPDVIIYTDRQRLAQVFENIISNTSKYSPGSDLQVEAYIKEGMLKCCIKDFGEGVSPEDIPFLFDKFFRGKNAKSSKQPGSGLGLYISKYILEKTGGAIKACNYSENGQSGFMTEISLKLL